MMLLVLMPLNAEDESEALINDIDQWIDIYFQGDVEPLEFVKLISDDFKMDLASRGLIMFSPKNPLLSGGDIFFETEEGKNNNRFVLSFKDNSKIKFKDLVKILGRVDHHTIFKIDDSAFSYTIPIEKEKGFLALARVKTQRKDRKEDEFVKRLTISIIEE